MTAEWELALQQIQQGDLDAGFILTSIKEYTSEITSELLSVNLPKEKLLILTCPKCKCETLLIHEKVIKCPDETCSWIQFRMICGIQLSVNEVSLLITKGRTPFIKKMKSKGGKTFDAFIVLKDDKTTKFEFENQKK